jgi:hypothetical protein
MRYLYIDNIRGFTDTYIPIKDVNFLVGENSTGKTTILEIIKILSDQTFWFTMSFDKVRELRFSSYQSIVNINSQDKSYFRIGMIGNYEEAGNNQYGDSTFLITFSNQNEVPTVSEYCWVNDKYEIKIIIQENAILYKFSSINQLSDAGICQIFKDWTNSKIGDSKEYKGIPITPMPWSELPFITQLVEHFVEGSVSCKSGADFINNIKANPNLPIYMRFNPIWLSSFRNKPKRTYDEYKYSFSPEGDHTPYLLRQILSEKNKSLSPRFLESLNNFGKNSGLFDSLGIKEFGDDLASPFEVDVIINDNPIAISEVGYGVSQALPIIVEILSREKSSWYAIQQPEIHLHPRAQAALGELFYVMAAMGKDHFFVETHSDYIVDRFRLCYQKYDQKDLDSQVLYFEKTPTGNKVYPIEIEKSGQYSEDQPSTFRDFFIKEEMALLGV